MLGHKVWELFRDRFDCRAAVRQRLPLDLFGDDRVIEGLRGSNPATIASCIHLALSNSGWTIAAEYFQPNVSRTVANVILGRPIV